MATFYESLNMGYTLRLIVNESSQNIANNTTTASYEFALMESTSTPGYWQNTPGIAWSVRTPATTTFATGTRISPAYDFRSAGVTTMVIKSGTHTVTHNAQGVYSGIRWEGHWAGQSSAVGGGVVGGAVSFTTIPRASHITTTGSFTTGLSGTIAWSPASTAFRHDIHYRIGTGSWVSIATNQTSSYAWEPPHSIFQGNNATSLTITFRLTTKASAGGSIIGTSERSYPLYLAAGQVPSISAVTWADQNTVVRDKFGVFLQNKSLIKGTLSAAGVLGSTLPTRQVIIGGAAFNESDIVTPGDSGTIVASGRVVDSRGRVATRVANIVVRPYQEPRVISYQVRRANSNGTVNPGGTHLRVDLNASATSVINGTERNALKIVVKTRPRGGAWTTRQTLTPGLTYNNNFVVSGGAIANLSQSYDVGIEVTDEAHSGTIPINIESVSTGATSMHITGSGVGIGKRHEQGALDVGPGGIYNNGVLVGAAATETARGTVERATQAEVNTGTDTTRYVSPATLRNRDYAPYAMASGIASPTETAYATITLPVGRFTQPPVVVAQVISTTGSVVSVPWIGANPTTTSFQVGIFTLGGARVAGVVHWQAVQMTSTSASG